MQQSNVLKLFNWLS